MSLPALSGDGLIAPALDPRDPSPALPTAAEIAVAAPLTPAGQTPLSVAPLRAEGQSLIRDVPLAAAVGDAQGPREDSADAPTAAGALAALEKDASSGEKSADSPAYAGIYDGKLLQRYRAPPGVDGFVDLSLLDPADTGSYPKDGEGKARRHLRKDQQRLDELQQLLYADGKRPVLIVIQGMDTSGKDGVIRHVMRSLNPQGVSVRSFKKPTPEEAAHHFLWRITNALPGKGMIGIFNRSQYEDILVPSVYGTFPPEEVESRYDVINRFEKEFVEKGGVILKFFLHISKAQQKRNLLARLADPLKNWKFSPEDLKSREKWPDFMRAYGKILARTNTDWAPWIIVPAENRWFRDFLVARVLRKTLEALKLSYPPPLKDADKIVIPD